MDMGTIPTTLASFVDFLKHGYSNRNNVHTNLVSLVNFHVVFMRMWYRKCKTILQHRIAQTQKYKH